MSDVNKDSQVEHPQGVCTPDGKYVDLVQIGTDHYLPVTIVDPSGDQQGDSLNPIVVDVESLNNDLTCSTVTLSTTAQEISFDAGADITIPSGAKYVSIQNGNSSNTVYIGSSGVTSDGATEGGFGLFNQGDSKGYNVKDGFKKYIIASAASTTVHIDFA